MTIEKQEKGGYLAWQPTKHGEISEFALTRLVAMQKCLVRYQQCVHNWAKRKKVAEVMYTQHGN